MGINLSKESPLKKIFLTFQIICFSILWFFASNAFGYSNISLKGSTIDAVTLAPVAEAKVSIGETGLVVLTGPDGQFIFENVPEGVYNIVVNSSRYNDTTLFNVTVLHDISLNLTIRLSPKVYHLGKLTIIGHRRQYSADKVTVISKEEIANSRAANLPELLEDTEGLYVQSSGPNGASRLKIRGGSPGQVLVLLDGQKMNASGTGEANLSTIPLEMVESIEIYKGGASAELGPDALAGAINIKTRPSKPDQELTVSVTGERSKWNPNSYALTLVNPISIKNMSNRLAFAQTRTDGDFDFTYSIQGTGGYDTLHTGTRQNNSFASDNFFISGIYSITDHWYLNYSGQYYTAESGLPGRVTQPNVYAHSVDRRKLASFGLKYETDRIELMLETGYAGLFQNFEDTLTIPQSLQFNGKFDNDIITVKPSMLFRYGQDGWIKLGSEFRHDRLEHDDLFRPQFSMGVSSRNNHAFQCSLEQALNIAKVRILDEILMYGTVRYDYTRTQKDSTSIFDPTSSNTIEYFSPHFGIALSKGDINSITIRADYGRSFRLPNLNALFWEGDIRSSGNPALRPERSEHSEAGVDLRYKAGPVELSTGMTYFHSYIYDLIVWQPDFQGVWKPQNLVSAQITGHEEYAELTLFEDLIAFRYQNSITDAINKAPGHNENGKKLVFYPGYLTTMTIGFNYKFLHAKYSVRLVDAVYTNISNTRYYDRYRLDDFSVGMAFDINNSWKLNTDIKLNNLGDREYILIDGYPMPGREWRFGLGISYHFSKGLKK